MSDTAIVYNAVAIVIEDETTLSIVINELLILMKRPPQFEYSVSNFLFEIKYYHFLIVSHKTSPNIHKLPSLRQTSPDPQSLEYQDGIS